MGQEAVSEVKPRVVLSRCLEIEACRYNGQGIRSSVVRLLDPHVDYVPVCPEVEIGLGVPRDPIRVERAGDGEGATLDSEHGPLRLVQPSTERDLTERMLGFSESFADTTGEVDGLLLKSRSPSCGIQDVKVYAGEAPVTGRGTGLFAAVMRDRYPHTAMEDEGRLTNAEIRHHWLTRVWASARLRAALRRAVAARGDLELTALAAAVPACGSLVLGLALIEGVVGPDEAFEAAQIEQSYQIERWGTDPELTETRRRLRADLGDAATFLALAHDRAAAHAG